MPRHGAPRETATSLDSVVRVPGGSCIDVPTLDGLLEIDDGRDTPAGLWIRVTEPVVVTDLGEYAAHAPLPLPEAPARSILIARNFSSRSSGSWGMAIVQRIDGEWRVVWSQIVSDG